MVTETERKERARAAAMVEWNRAYLNDTFAELTEFLEQGEHIPRADPTKAKAEQLGRALCARFGIKPDALRRGN